MYHYTRVPSTHAFFYRSRLGTSDMSLMSEQVAYISAIYGSSIIAKFFARSMWFQCKNFTTKLALPLIEYHEEYI